MYEGVRKGLHMKTFGERLRYARHRWGLDQGTLATRAEVGVATIRRCEGDAFGPRLSTAQKLADALQVRVEWLLTGDGDMVTLAKMTPDAQVKAQTGPGTDGLPGFVVVEGGAWYRDNDGAWVVDASQIASEVQ